MGLFTNNKKLCPICGNPTPRLLASAVEGQNLCKECAAKIDLPDGVLNSMTLDEFREYINCYDANKPLRDSFTETYRYDFGFFKGSLLLDMDHQLSQRSDFGPLRLQPGQTSCTHPGSVGVYRDRGL
jgi:hypothetical protein